MRILWICGLPFRVQQTVLSNEDHGAQSAWSWILGHFPPPEGVDLHVACLWPGRTRHKSFDFQGVTFHLVPCPARGRALFLFQRDPGFFRGLYNELKPDIVHGWGTEDSFGLVACLLAPKRHVVGIQGLITVYRTRVPMHHRTILTSLTERLTLQAARWVVAESGYSLRAAKPLCPGAQMRVIEHPLRREFLETTPADGTSKQILFLGRIDERKGISDALRAFAEMGDSEWKLLVVGEGLPSAEFGLIKLARELGIADRIRLDRALTAGELASAMRDFSVFLLPTRIDTGPTALKEALTLGLWPVCYDNTGPGEYVRKFEFGSLANDLDLEDLTAKLRQAIETRPWLDAARREKLRAQTREAFARENVWAQLERLYSEIIGS